MFALSSASSIAHQRVIEIFPSYTIVGSQNFVRFAIFKTHYQEPPRVIPAAVFFAFKLLVS